MNSEINDMILNACCWAREAGGVQLEYFRKPHLDIHTKENESDIVTKADKASDALLQERIKRAYPSHSILTEESGESVASSDWRWVIDPLDGTTNFAEGLPYFAVSIALEYQGTTVGGVVFVPYLNELFHAIKGEGAWLDGNPISPRPNDRMDRAVFSTGFPIDKNVNPDNNLAEVGRVLPLARGLRRLGAAAVDICYTAAGFLDGYWEMNLHEWDVAAAKLIAEEAGAATGYFRYDRNISFVAATPALFDELFNLIKRS